MNESIGGNRRILLVDDNPSIHEDFRKILVPDNLASLMDAEAATFFGEPQPTSAVESFQLDSAFQGEEALIKVRNVVAAGFHRHWPLWT